MGKSGKGSRRPSLHQRVNARHMALKGFVTRIIIIETGLTDKQVRSIYAELDAEGYDLSLNRTTRAIRGGATLLRGHMTKVHASLVMQLYYKIGGEGIKTSTSITALEEAYRMYSALLCELSKLDRTIKDSVFTISDAWCLAVEYRSGKAMFEKCDNCNCDFFTSIYQSTGISCPFCFEPKAATQASKPKIIKAPTKHSNAMRVKAIAKEMRVTPFV